MGEGKGSLIRKQIRYVHQIQITKRVHYQIDTKRMEKYRSSNRNIAQCVIIFSMVNGVLACNEVLYVVNQTKIYCYILFASTAIDCVYSMIVRLAQIRLTEFTHSHRRRMIPFQVLCVFFVSLIFFPLYAIACLMSASITLILRIWTIKDNLCGLWNNERIWQM